MSEPRTLAIVIGASKFPNSPGLGNGDAFENSAQDFREYLHERNGLDIPTSDVLDLFDDPRPAGELLGLIIEFLEKRQKKTSTNVERLLVYYVGHGGFTSTGQEYFLAVRSTKERNEGPSSIRISDLGHIIRENARFLCQYLILDCCFSAQAYKAFQSGPGDAAVTKTLDSVPRKGTALLCSSGPREVSLAPENCTYTMFSDALLKALRTGDPKFREYLSLSDLGALIERNLRDVYEDGRVRPQVHCPNQPEGDLTNLPLFPNPALRSIVTPSERLSFSNIVATKIPEDIISVLRGSIPNLKVAAVRELIDLFRSASSLNFMELIAAELTKLSEEDDSRQVQKCAAEALVECKDIVRLLENIPQDTPEQNVERSLLILQEELKIAALVQRGLSRPILHDIPFATVESACVSCKELGGDFFDSIETPTGLIIMLADVSGKGMAAAIFASMLQGVLSAVLSQDGPLEKALEYVNRFVTERTAAHKYATIVVARLSPNGHLEVVNCGGIWPTVVSGDSVKNIEIGNVPLGLIPNATFDVSHSQLMDGDRLVFVTDGVTEAEDATGEQFGERFTQNIAEGVDHVMSELQAFVSDAPIIDDYTIAVVRYRQPAES
jgi:serine phosphatase RsbU (regulator of sigma subunit)